MDWTTDVWFTFTGAKLWWQGAQLVVGALRSAQKVRHVRAKARGGGRRRFDGRTEGALPRAAPSGPVCGLSRLAIDAGGALCGYGQICGATRVAQLPPAVAVGCVGRRSSRSAPSTNTGVDR